MMRLATAASGSLPVIVTENRIATGASSRGMPAVVIGAALCLAAGRIAIEGRLAAALGRPLAVRDYALIPARNLVVAALFRAGLFGRHTRWKPEAAGRAGDAARIREGVRAPESHRDD